MPFTKLVDHHSCPTPKTRDDGSQLVLGDEWTCDAIMTDGSGRSCGKAYRWTSDQREGNYWVSARMRF